MPAVMTTAAPEVKAKFDAPDFIETNEEMLKEEFTKYFQVVICPIQIKVNGFLLSDNWRYCCNF